MGSSSPIFGLNILKYLSCHHLEWHWSFTMNWCDASHSEWTVPYADHEIRLWHRPRQREGPFGQAWKYGENLWRKPWKHGKQWKTHTFDHLGINDHFEMTSPECHVITWPPCGCVWRMAKVDGLAVLFYWVCISNCWFPKSAGRFISCFWPKSAKTTIVHESNPLPSTKCLPTLWSKAPAKDVTETGTSLESLESNEKNTISVNCSNEGATKRSNASDSETECSL